jgi:futalosine hydrolase
MKILIVAATLFEIQPSIDFFEKKENQSKVNVEFLVTGIGMTATTYHLTKKLQNPDYQLIINAGIAGAFNPNELQLGDVVNVVAEKFADLGAENHDGSFINFYENGLINPNENPFINGELLNIKGAEFEFLPLVSAISVNKVSGFAPSIEKLKTTFSADIESMEGAAFTYVCLLEEVNFFQIRAISNYVEPRNRDNWQMPLAIKNLNSVLIEMVLNL